MAINSEKELKARLWETVTRHSTAYQKQLGLSDEDLSVLEEVQGHPGMLPNLDDHARCSFLQVSLGGNGFSLFVKHVCGPAYGAGWRKVIMAHSPTAPENQEDVGRGTTHIVALSEELHKKLCLALSS